MDFRVLFSQLFTKFISQSKDYLFTNTAGQKSQSQQLLDQSKEELLLQLRFSRSQVDLSAPNWLSVMYTGEIVSIHLNFVIYNLAEEAFRDIWSGV